MLVVLPVIDTDAARACIRTMHPDVRARLLVIDQSRRGMTPLHGVDMYRPTSHSRMLEPTRNLGISRCMNLAVDRLRASEGDLLLWVSTSMRFGPDGGCRLMAAGARSELGVVAAGPVAWHAVALRLAAFDLAGRWDENFYPGYYEDTDWRRRLCLATGDRCPLPEVDIGGRACDGQGYDVLRYANPGRQVVNFDAHKEYYAAKWGGCPPESVETFEQPWGDWPLDWWPEASRDELIDRYRLGT